MAVKYSDYLVVADNLKIHKDNDHKFYFDVVIDGDRKRKAYTIKNRTDWGKRECIRYAKTQLEEYITSIEAGYISTSTIKLDRLFELYYATLDSSKKWTVKKQYIYNHYIKSYIGNKPIEKIREMDVRKVIADMNSRGLSPRTQKSILEVLKPLFMFATTNKYLKENPIINIVVKIPSQKKIVTEATALFNKVHDGIKSYYANEPFYQALFLFGFSGRRKSEILNLKWENIDLTNNYYWLDKTKSGNQQRNPLPSMIKKQLLLIQDEHKGLVFKSPVTGGVIVNIDRQVRQLKKHIGIDNLSLHYMRNILVSAYAENGVSAMDLSGILGHNDVNTINKYLSLNTYKSGQIGLRAMDDILDVAVIELVEESN